MNTPHAYNEIAIEYGGNIVFLRPSLRAATCLERLHNGFPMLLVKVQQGHTETLREIVQHSATDRAAGQRLVGEMKGATIVTIHKALINPAFALITALMTPDLHKDQGEAAKAPTGKPVKWADFYADTYKIATGWLGWTPDTAWNATMPEIMQAFDGHIEQLKAIHGGADDDATGASEMSADQRQSNIDQGLDPEFDRAALHALRAKL